MHAGPGDPLLIVDSIVEGEASGSAALRYVKGMARACTILTIADLTLGADLRTHHPSLFRSMSAVRVRRCTVAVDRLSMALENARLSARGSIRRAHDVVTWLGKLQLLRANGQDPAAVLKKWNDSCTREAQVTGNRRLCCLSLLERAPDSAVELLLAHVSEVGAEGSAFSEDAFANKKLLPGPAVELQTETNLKLEPVSPCRIIPKPDSETQSS